MKILFILKSVHNVYKATKKPEGANIQKQATTPYEERLTSPQNLTAT